MSVDVRLLEENICGGVSGRCRSKRMKKELIDTLNRKSKHFIETFLVI
jgi:hypothetical protein